MSDRSTWRPLGGSSGFYIDDEGVMHVDEDEAIRSTGYEPTEENRRVLRKAALKLAMRLGIELGMDE